MRSERYVTCERVQRGGTLSHILHAQVRPTSSLEKRHRASLFSPKELPGSVRRMQTARSGVVLKRALGRALLGFLVVLAAACADDPEDAPTGKIGESCTARRDCGAALACVANVCIDPETGAGSMFGGAGESCDAKNDCGPNLACIAHVCVAASTSTEITGKACYKVECATKDDCCKDFSPSPGCDKFKQDCETDPAYCLTYRTYCECNRACEAELCVDTPPGCKSSAECGSLLAPFCNAGVCSECAEHADCAGENDKCIAGKCQAPCTQNEHCPVLWACQNGQCVEVGCNTDKECFFLLKDSRATCNAGECLVPCTYNQECGDFQVCKDGACTFVGCETDAECRVYFGLAEEVGGVKAVCK